MTDLIKITLEDTVRRAGVDYLKACELANSAREILAVLEHKAKQALWLWEDAEEEVKRHVQQTEG